MIFGMLVTDADNTLWDTNKVFAEAQMSILDAIEYLAGRKAEPRDRLAYIRQFDQSIAQSHEAGLKYPPRLLVHAIVNALGAEPLGDEEVAPIVEAYFDNLSRKPRLRAGVRSTLKFLRKLGVVIIVASEGNEKRIADNLKSHDLERLVSDVVIGRKSCPFYDDLFARFPDVLPKVCVGDQLDRDIVPAKKAGFTTLYFPGGFRPSWEFDIGAKHADRTIRSYADVKDAFIL